MSSLRRLKRRRASFKVAVDSASFASALDYDGFQNIPEGIEDNVPFEVRLTNSAAGEERSYECRMHTYSDSASLLVDREFTLTG